MKLNKHIGRLLLPLFCMLFFTAAVHAQVGDVYTLIDDASLRQSPDSLYAPINAVAKGERAIELGSTGEWKKVRLSASGNVGWVPVDALASPVANAEPLPTDDTGVLSDAQPALPQNKIISLPQRAAVEPDDVRRPDAFVVEPKPELVSSAPEVPAPDVEKTVVQTTDMAGGFYRFNKKANLRAGPGAQFDTVSWAGLASQASELSRQGDWVRIQMQVSKRIGWVYKDSLSAVAKLDKAKLIPAEAGLQVFADKLADSRTATSNKLVAKALIKHDMKPSVEAGGFQSFDVLKGASQVQSAMQTMPVKVAVAKAEEQGEPDRYVGVQKKESVQPAQQQVILRTSRDIDRKMIAPKVEKPLMVAESKAVTTKLVSSGPQAIMHTTMIRTGASALSDVLGWAGIGAQVQAIASQGKWTQVRMLDSGRTGWIETVSLNASAVPSSAVSPVATAMPKLAKVQLQTNKAEPRLAVNSINAAVKKPSVAMMLDSQPTVTLMPDKAKGGIDAKASEKNLHKFNKKANLRAGPNAKFDTVSWAGIGSQAIELDRKGDWVRVQMQVSKRIGWVYRQSLDIVKQGVPALVGGSLDLVSMAVDRVNGSAVMPMFNLAGDTQSLEKANVGLTTKPVESHAGVGREVVSSNQATLKPAHNMYFFKRTSDLRAGPGANFERIGWGGKNEAVEGIGQQGDWRRVRFTMSGKMGWVFSPHLLHAKDPGRFFKSKVALASASTISTVDTDVAELQGLQEVVQQSSDKPANNVYFFKRTSDLRAGPGEEFDRVGWGGRNEAAEEMDRQGDWRRIRMTMSGKVGWVFDSYLVAASDPGRFFKGVVSSMPPKLIQSDGQIDGQTEAQTVGRMYQVVRTEPLRADAGGGSELIGSVQKGDTVAWLEERNGWARVNPQIDGSKVGWLDAKLLKEMKPTHVEHTAALISQDNILAYKDRISTGETFNFSFAALEQALYKVPVEDIHIRIGKEDLKAIFLKRQFDQSAFEIRLTTGRHRLRGTVKVLGSSTRIFKKKSLLIKLDKQSGRWYGHRRMALRSMASDKALMREWMAWKMMAALGMKVPEVHFTRVTFNRGEKVALYLSVEWMGREFLEGNNLDARGEFYQPDDAAHCGDLYSTDQMEFCFNKITPRDGDYSSLKAMARAVDGATNSNIDKVLAKYFHDESIINWIAVNSLVTNGDTYNKNYWLYYHPTEEKWTVVPWDYNLTFGRTYDQYSNKAFKIFNDNFQYYYPPDVGAGNPIKDKALRNPVLRTRLEEKIKHLIGMEPNGSEQTFGWFSPTVMHARINNLAAVVGQEIYKDTFLSYGEGDFTKTYESLMHYVTAHDHFLKVKLFGDFPWEPEPPNQPFLFMQLPEILQATGSIDAGGESLHLVDNGWGYFIAHLDLDEPLKSKVNFKVEIEGGLTPKLLPVGQSSRRCVERSWVLQTITANVSVAGDLKLEYTQENSRRSEINPTIHEELLELWMLDGNRWQPIQTEVNEYSNTLIAKNIHVKSGHSYRFVACSPF